MMMWKLVEEHLEDAPPPDGNAHIVEQVEKCSIGMFSTTVPISYDNRENYEMLMINFILICK